MKSMMQGGPRSKAPSGKLTSGHDKIVPQASMNFQKKTPAKTGENSSGAKAAPMSRKLDSGHLSSTEDCAYGVLGSK